MSCKVGETLRSNSSEYSVLKFIGEGGFGKVAVCRKAITKETVAVKILKEDPEVMKYAEREVDMLQYVSGMNPDKINVVKFLERFQHEGQPCLAFERLQIDLFEVMKEDQPMCLNGIRPIAQQLMVALDALQGMEIMHTDIKPDNVMIARLDMPVRVKLIDFGLACHTSEVWCGQTLQTTGYRAPEVFFGLPLTGAIDVWSVGCVLGFLYLAGDLFPYDSAYENLRFMLKFLGQPEDHLLRAGKHTHKYFTEVSTGEAKGQAEEQKTWRLLTLEEYNKKHKTKIQETKGEMPDSLDVLLDLYPLEDGAAESEDRLAFVDLLKHLLHLNWAKRMTPSQALQHPFITMSHLSKHSDNKDYLRNTIKMMGSSPSPDQVSSGSNQDSGVTIPSSIVLEIDLVDEDKDDQTVEASDVPTEETPDCLTTEETPNGPTENTPDGPTEVTPDVLTKETPDGLTTEETPDGPTENTPDVPTKETPDGVTTKETPDGVTTKETPDGVTTKETPDGVTTEETPNGPTENTPDGPTENTPDVPTKETPDGVTTEETPDGPTEVTPDGPIVETTDGPTVETTDSPTEETTDRGQCEYTLEELQACLLKNYNRDNISSHGVTQLCDRIETHDSFIRPPTPFRKRLRKGICDFLRRVKKAFCCCCQVEDD